MPWQGHLFVGVRVRSYDDVRKIYKQFKKPEPQEDDDLEYKTITEIPFKYKGEDLVGDVQFQREREGGCQFPVGAKEDYSDAIVGFNLTSRYSGSVLDKDTDHGRPEPFVFDPQDIIDILVQVRKIWKEAQVLIWDNFH